MKYKIPLSGQFTTTNLVQIINRCVVPILVYIAVAAFVEFKCTRFYYMPKIANFHIAGCIQDISKVVSRSNSELYRSKGLWVK